MRQRTLAVITVVAAVAGTLATAAPASATPSRALAATVTSAPVLTLPAADGVRDTATVRVASAVKGAVDLLAVRGNKVVHIADAVALRHASHDWGRTIRVPVAALTAGTWSIRARRSDDHRLRAGTTIRVGSGRPTSVRLVPAAPTLYPYKDGTLDAAVATVVATDETGTALPVHGTIRIDTAKKHRTRTLHGGSASIPVTALPLGAATLTATVRTPAGKPVIRTAHLTLAATGVGTATLARSSDTLQPVRDGLLDTLTLTTSGAASGGSPAKTSGTLVLTGPAGVVRRWVVPDGASHPVTWDGRVNGTIVPGVYTATLTLTGPEGAPKVRTRTITVTKDHLPYTVQNEFTVAAGNQQGLAVHDGVFYVGYDNGDGTSRIEAYDSAGTLTATLGPIDIGHAAELSYSTTSGLLYAANGGATVATKIWAIRPTWDAATLADPSSAIVDTVDVGDLGNNGMVAVDDANNRLLVFAGTAPDFRVTPLTISDTQDASGQTVPRYTRGTSVPIAITGVPQGVEVVGTQLWVFTSLKGRNHLAKYDLPGSYSSLAAAAGSSADVMWPGEGEGLAVDWTSGVPSYFVGAHAANRIGLLVPVPDE